MMTGRPFMLAMFSLVAMRTRRMEAAPGRKAASKEALEDPNVSRTPPESKKCNLIVPPANKPLLPVANVRGSGFSSPTADSGTESSHLTAL